MKAVQLTQISFAVPAIVVENITKRAGPLNIRASEYARRLFEAAYAARIAQERGGESGDTALDRAVRDVFLLADCEPEYIADAIGAPVEWVARILEGWRRIAGELTGTPPAGKPKPSASAPPTPPPARATGSTVIGRLSAEEVRIVRILWREGKSIPEIADVLGCDRKRVQNFATRNRNVCPSRRGD